MSIFRSNFHANMSKKFLALGEINHWNAHILAMLFWNVNINVQEIVVDALMVHSMFSVRKHVAEHYCVIINVKKSALSLA